jgi:transcriptional regulator with XRE-family HTH domain
VLRVTGAADWVRELRDRHGLSQAQLAYRAGTSQQALSRIEARQSSPSIALLERLAAACGEELQLRSQPRSVPFDPEQLATEVSDPIEMRAERAFSWNLFAGELVIAGAKARARGAL